MRQKRAYDPDRLAIHSGLVRAEYVEGAAMPAIDECVHIVLIQRIGEAASGIG
jgi:hypothetical protein